MLHEIFFLYDFLIYIYFIDYLEKSLYMLWLDPLVMRLGCNKCRGLIGDWLAKLATLHGDS